MVLEGVYVYAEVCTLDLGIVFDISIQCGHSMACSCKYQTSEFSLALESPFYVMTYACLHSSSALLESRTRELYKSYESCT